MKSIDDYGRNSGRFEKIHAVDLVYNEDSMSDFLVSKNLAAKVT